MKHPQNKSQKIGAKSLLNVGEILGNFNRQAAKELPGLQDHQYAVVYIMMVVVYI